MKYPLRGKWLWTQAFVFTGVLMFSTVFGGGPRTLGFDGRVFKWDQGDPAAFPVRFIVDNGPLAPTISRDEGAQLIRQAFQQWADIPSSNIQFLDLGFLEIDLTAENYQAFFDGEIRPENPVVFDGDGGIIEEVLGVGASQSVLGFAGERFLDFNSSSYRSAWIVLNGRLADQGSVFAGVIAHEAGHFIGLDHTQINSDLAFNGTTSDDDLIPLMYPFALPGGPGTPIRDDIAWVSWLYPAVDLNLATGTIQGTVSRRTGGAFQGANVVAVQVTDGQVESRSEVVSSISDFRATGDGSYQLPGLVPGQYAVFIEPLNPLFVQGSGVGPFDNRFDDFEKDYFNGKSESGGTSDDPTERVLITVGASETVGMIDLISNEPLRPLSALGDDDAVPYEFPPGFTFPFFGRLYDQVFVNSDGNLTFGQGQGIVASRDEARFLSGPPRVAPLFTDLDPSESGEVVVSTQDGEVTFIWEGVPEFSSDGSKPGNEFSVTLFESGDVEFSYQTIEVTPDLDPVQAVVGLSPGGLSEGAGLDLSAEISSLRVGVDPVYEVFSEDGFDLTGQSVLFQVEPNRLYFPFYSGDERDFSGYAITNLSPVEAVLEVEGLGGDGALLLLPDESANPGNPGFEEIASQQQLARLGRQFFGVDLSATQQGWIRMTSNTPELGSFFQVGGDLSGPVTRLDGALAFTDQSDVLFFTRIFDGLSTFPTFGLSGPQDAVTTFHIANPNDEEITLVLTLYANTGLPVAPEVIRPLPPLGSLSERVQSLFNISSPIADGYVRVEVEGLGAVGFSLIEVQDNLIGLNAAFPGAKDTLYSAQLATGVQAGAAVFTSLKLVNTSGDPRQATITVLGENGSSLGARIVVLNPNFSFQVPDIGQYLGLGSPAFAALTSGSIRVEVDGPGVIGDVIFGDPGDPDTGVPNQIDFLAGMPLQERLLTRAVFSQVANGALEPDDPSTETFTGITMLNPTLQTAQVTVSVFDSMGRLVGGTDGLTLSAGQRFSRLIGDLLPGTARLLGGYILLESDQGLVAQVFFGNSTLQFLSAVPPVIY